MLDNTYHMLQRRCWRGLVIGVLEGYIGVKQLEGQADCLRTTI